MSKNILLTIFLLFQYSKADIPLGIETKNSRIYFMGYLAYGQNLKLLEMILLSTNLYIGIHFKNIAKQQEWVTLKKKMEEDNIAFNNQTDSQARLNRLLHLANSKHDKVHEIFANSLVRLTTEQEKKVYEAIEEFCSILKIKVEQEVKEEQTIKILLNELLSSTIAGFQKPWNEIVRTIFEQSAKTLFMDYWNDKKLPDSIILLDRKGRKIIKTTEKLEEFIKASYEEFTHDLPKENLKKQTILRILQDEDYSKRFLVYAYEFFSIQMPDDYEDFAENRNEYLTWFAWGAAKVAGLI